VPFVLRLTAIEVQEEASWGINRPGWGWAIERSERRLVRAADLVLPVTSSLDSMLSRLGIEAGKRLRLDNAADLTVFRPGPRDETLVRTHDLDSAFVVGWVGGFQPFHGLHLVPAIGRLLREQVPRARLYLVGTGPLFNLVQETTRDLRDVVQLVGSVPHSIVPDWIRCFDVALILGDISANEY
jgi:glycosyltransferase involved in cell wall biosynthesis